MNLRRIGYLVGGRAEPNAQDVAFDQAMAKLGYVEGTTIAVERRFTVQSEQLERLAAELVDLRVDLIVAGTSPAIDATKRVTTTVPIVMPTSGDPVKQGYAVSLGRPGGNITGLTTLSSTPLSGKRLEMLKEVVPGLSQVAVLWNSANQAKVIDFDETQAAAQSMGLTLQSYGVGDAAGLPEAFQAISAGRADALCVLTDLFMLPHAPSIAAFAIEHRLATVFGAREYPKAGGLMCYGPDSVDLFRRAAVYVDKILKGAKPADLPIEFPSTFDYIINLETARAIGLTIPASMQQQATELIQ